MKSVTFYITNRQRVIESNRKTSVKRIFEWPLTTHIDRIAIFLFLVLLLVWWQCKSLTGWLTISPVYFAMKKCRWWRNVKKRTSHVSYKTIKTSEIIFYIDLCIHTRRKETVIVNKSFYFDDEYAFSVIRQLFFSIMTSSNPAALSFFVDFVVNLILFEECCFRRQN